MRKAGGYAVIIDPDAGLTEIDTFTCGHCNGITHVKARASPDEIGSMCRLCMKMVCVKCASHGCTPFEKRLEAIEAEDRKRRLVASWV